MYLAAMKYSIRSWRMKYCETLAGSHSKDESEALFSTVLETITGLSRVNQVVRQEEIPTEAHEAVFLATLEALEAGQPLQYILKRAYFYDLLLNVDSRVLIPRPETEELVQLMLHDLPKDTLASILDIGTGSGCIPIALKKNRPLARVFAVDISEDALALARENANEQETEIEFFKVDILSHSTASFPWSKLDVIVSNPPYVPASEKIDMARHVLEHEPHLALFVDDEDPLLFYRRIARFAKEQLKKGGRLYFEIHADFGKDTVDLLASEGFQHVLLVKDLSGRDRLIRCVFNS